MSTVLSILQHALPYVIAALQAINDGINQTTLTDNEKSQLRQIRSHCNELVSAADKHLV